jgi:pimeloyl-ACP methyl ester carboxylesterase
MAPRFRVVSVSSRGDSPYMVNAVDLHATLRQFGFSKPILVGERLGCLTALLLAAWYPSNVHGLVLIDPMYAPPPAETIEARALRDCPPDVARLRVRLSCPVLDAASTSETLIQDIQALVVATLP